MMPRLDYRDERAHEWTILEKFYRGSKLLDEKCPKWFLLVDLASFDFVNPTKCILAQVFGGYTKGLEALGLAEPGKAWDNPFAGGEHGFAGKLAESDEFQELWTVAVHQRMHGPNGPFPPTLSQDACDK